MKQANWWQTALASAALAFAGFATGASGDDDARYLVVDLSGGPEAESWPVTWMDNMPGSGWTDVYKTTKLVLRRIDVGLFTMGGTRWDPDDQTPHEVFVEHPFYIGVFEVTQKQFELVTGYNPAEYTGDTRPVESVSYDNIRGPNSGSGWPGSRTVDEGSFLGLLRDKTGIEFDLPSEAQWEYACRAGTQTDFNSGQNVVYDEHDPNMAAVGRYYYNKGSSDHHARVGLYAPNAWGLYDMHGNVWEYCLDWYGAYPSSGCVPEFFGPDTGEQRIRRGGSWGNSSLKCISPNRDTALPGTGSFYNGFRLAFTTGKTGYRIRYNANGGTGADSFQYATNGTSVTLAPCAFSKPNHLFAGWSTQQEGPVQYADGKTVQELQPDSDWTASLYAIWEKLQTVTFDANGGSCDTTQCVYSIGKTYCTLPEATRSRYIFAGWWTAASGGSQVTADSTVTSAETRTLYAHWTPTEQIVTFDPNGGKCKTQTKAYALGGTYASLPTPTLAHYAFAGWWTAAEDGQQVSATSPVTGGETRTLYAHWTLAEQVVTFNPNGGSCDTARGIFTVEKAYGDLPVATMPHYAFAGWWTKAKGGEQVMADSPVPLTATRTLYAHWTLVEQVVTFDPNGGSCGTAQGAFAVEKAYGALPVATMSHHAFAGWWTEAEGGEEVTVDSPVPLTATRTLYAHWTLVEQVVTFWPLGGSCATSNRIYTVGTHYGWLPEATREGIAFAGWFDAFTGECVETSDEVTVAQERWLVARWGTVAGAAKVTGYTPDDGTGSCTVRFKGRASVSYNLQRRQKMESGSWTTVATKMAEEDGDITMLAEMPEGWASGFYRVVAGVGEEGMDVGDWYLVVDMSGGEKTDHWPFSLLEAAPVGGWTDEYKTEQLVLRVIPAGTFVMGSQGGEYDEGQHTVTLTKPFCMGVFEVTQRQWELAMGGRPSYFKNRSHYATRPVERVSYNDIRGDAAGTGWPTTNAVDATSFLGVLRAKTGLAFDLPTEAQWEYACRAGTTTALNSGKNLTAYYCCSNMAEVGRYAFNSGRYDWSQDSSWDSSKGTAKVGSYQPNAWGLYDMHGNVWEWCLDWYGLYDTGAVVDPTGYASGSRRVRRGGSWYDDAALCRSAERRADAPSNDGFRLCCPAVLP